MICHCINILRPSLSYNSFFFNIIKEIQQKIDLIWKILKKKDYQKIFRFKFFSNYKKIYGNNHFRFGQTSEVIFPVRLKSSIFFSYSHPLLHTHKSHSNFFFFFCLFCSYFLLYFLFIKSICLKSLDAKFTHTSRLFYWILTFFPLHFFFISFIESLQLSLYHISFNEIALTFHW